MGKYIEMLFCMQHGTQWCESESREEIEESRYWLLIYSIFETVSVCCENDQTREKAFSELYELEEINSELLEAAEKAHKKLSKLQELLADEGYESFNEGMNFTETIELEQAIKKAKGDDE